jgi:hypothetical protein
MPVTLTINNNTYNFPASGEDPNWGPEATDWAIAVTDVLNTLLAPGDILLSTATINNNVAVLTNVNGLLFDPSQVRAANVSYSVYRTSTSNPSGYVEEGTIFLIYDNNASAGNKWTMSQRINGNAGISFNITDAGQIQYITTDIGAAGYSGTMKFLAKTLLP